VLLLTLHVRRVSATNCARTYELAQARRDSGELHEDWQFGSKLTTEHVWDAFVILALLEDHEKQGTRLQVPHIGKQKDRFTAEMAQRNERIVRDGQPEIAHYCNKCMRTYETTNGLVHKVEAVVTDGLTIGHPCCASFACPNALGSMRHRFCPTHGHLHMICAIVGCSQPVVEFDKTIKGKVTISKMKTCSDPVHQEMERLNQEQSKANFQLSQKLMRQKVAHPNDALAEKRLADLVDLEDAEEWFEVDPNGGEVQLFTVNNPGATGELETLSQPCPTHPETGNRKIKAQFGRRRTHNEQVIVRPCGMLCSRATFFAAEAVSNVLVSQTSCKFQQY
jgi:hypothetical protein